MSAQSIRDVLARWTTGTTLALPAEAFGRGPVQEALATFCGGTLTVGGAQVATSGETVTVEGAGAGSPFEGAGVNAVFGEAGAGVVTLQLTATLPAVWTLDDGWPQLHGTFVTGVDLGGGTLALVSGDGTSVQPALSFAGTMRLGSEWGAFGWLLATATSFELSGAIAVQQGVPVLRWSAPILAPVDIGLLKDVELHLELACTARPTPATAWTLEPSGRSPPFFPEPSLALIAEAEVAGTTVPISVDIAGRGGIVTIAVGIEGIAGDALTLLGRWLGVDLVQYLPRGSGFDPSQSVHLQAIELDVAPGTATMSAARIWLGNDTLRWTVAPGIAVTGIVLLLEVPHPTAPTTVYSTLFGTVKVGSGTLDISCAYAEQLMLAAVLGPEPVQLDALLTQIGLPAGTLPPLALDQLELIVAPAAPTWSLVTALSGDWTFDLGLVTVALTQAWAQLEYDPGGAPPTRGAIGLTADIGGVVTCSGEWTLPGTFALRATFASVELAALATTLTGTTPPALGGTSLTDASVSIVLNTTTGDYELALAATATHGQAQLGRAAFEIARNGGAWGFLVGFVLPSAWSPADVWSELAFLRQLTIEQAGMTLSTLPAGTKPNIPAGTVPSVPATVAEGASFFATLALTGGLEAVSQLFAGDVTLELLGVVDLASPAGTIVKATLTEPAAKNAMAWGSVSLTIDVGRATVSLAATGTYTLGSGDWTSPMTLLGAGSVTLDPPAGSLVLAVEQWQPFGIRGLLVDEVALTLALDTEGVNVGFYGKLTIGEGAGAFNLTLGGVVADFEVPDALVFELETASGTTATLAAMIGQFTDLSLESVPVLEAIGFASLGFYCIAIPEGWRVGAYTYPPGIGVHGDITIYSWEATFDFELQEQRGVIAKGAISKPIVLGDVLTISDVTGALGPSGSIDTTQLAAVAGPGTVPAPYFTLDGTIDLLGIRTSIEAKAAARDFTFVLEFDFRETVEVHLQCSLIDDTSFSAEAAFDFDLDVTLGPWPSSGPTVIPQVHIDGPSGAASLGLAIDRTVVFALRFGLRFDWRTVHVNVAFELTAAELGNDLTRLDEAVTRWLESNVDAVFHEVLQDAEHWTALVKEGAFALEADAEEIAEILKTQFDAAVADVAGYLSELSYDLTEMVEALVSVFDVTAAEAIHLLGFEPGKQPCALTLGDERMTTPPPIAVSQPSADRALFALTGAPAGQRILSHYVVHRDELDRLLGTQPELERQVRALIARAGDEPATPAELAAVLTTLRPSASPALQATIDEVLTELDAHAGVSLGDYLTGGP